MPNTQPSYVDRILTPLEACDVDELRATVGRQLVLPARLVNEARRVIADGIQNRGLTNELNQVNEEAWRTVRRTLQPNDDPTHPANALFSLIVWTVDDVVGAGFLLDQGALTHTETAAANLLIAPAHEWLTTSDPAE